MALAWLPSPRTASLVRVVDAVEADLHVDVVHARQPAGLVGGHQPAVGRELHADALRDAVLDDLEEVGPQHRLAAADVDVEHPQPAQVVDDGLHLVGGELVRVAGARGAEAVDALQVAGVGPLPGEADRGVEPGLELVGHRGAAGGRRLERRVDPRGELGTGRGRARRHRSPGRGQAVGLGQEPGPLERGQGLGEAAPPTIVDAGAVVGRPGAREAVEVAHQGHQLGRPQQGQPAVAVVVGEGAERLGPQGDPRIEAVGLGRVEAHRGGGHRGGVADQ